MELGVVRFSSLGSGLTKGRQAMDGKVIPFDPHTFCPIGAVR